ncbi:MAG: tRNA (N6-isopentenyl adenosine(37)-C2)-methylthiotransferase MiaB [Acidobacteria bacterium]|nr:MAG: tRNA (N6-isopentenyl adenosine(37)-C2)-methylthiotransferase MiaB [Acidobacteriota bacterium]
MAKFKIETWGCQMNEYDSQKMVGLLKQDGFVQTESEEEADIFILNTCSVREKAVHKIHSRIGVIKKRYKGQKIVGICGCVASQEGRALMEKIPYLKFVLGTRSTHLITEAVNRALNGSKFLDSNDHKAEMDAPITFAERAGHTKAYISIIEGCDNFCTYCIVPFTRGREHSRPLSIILDEVKDAVEVKGIHEIELLGQNVNSYAFEGKTFADVLEAVSNLQGVYRIRFLTSHPKDFNENLVRVIAAHDNICPTIHLPMQSGSDRILKKMGRKYTRSEYLDKIRMIRDILPESWISSDFIVGFPGENEKDFLDTMDVIQSVRYDNLYSFKYSPRPHTAALKLKDPLVPDSIASNRLSILQHTQEEIQMNKHMSMVGHEYTVLVESLSKKNPKLLTGRTEGNHVVHFEAGRGRQLIGKLVDVRIETVTMASLKASLI